MTEEKKRTKWSDLLWGVRRSIRYHLRRRKFFDQLGFASNFLTIISGGGAIVSVSGESPNTGMVVLFGILVGVFSAIDLVVGCSTAARDHHDLARKFSELEKEMTRAGDTPGEQQIVELTNKRLEIEEDEPPVLRVLDADCHNELVRALGKPDGERVKIGPIQRLLKQFIDISPDNLPKMGSLQVASK